MARVFLNDETYNAASDDAEINGSAGTEQVNVFAGVTGLDVTSSVERVDLSGDIADFTFSSFGNSVTILDGNGDTVAAVSGADGKQLVFGDGALDVAFDAGTNELTVGGETVDGNAAAITPAASEIDATTTSESANGGGNGGGGAGGGGAAQTFTLTESTNIAAEGDTVTYTVTADSAVTEDTTLTVSVSGSDLNGAATAASATDYTLSDTSVTFADGAAAGSTQTFTVTANTDDIAEGLEGIKVSLLDDSFATVASETTAITNVDAPAQPQSFTLTANADNFTGDAEDDTFSGVAGTIDSDNLSGGAGDDTLNLTVTVADDDNAAFTSAGIENMNVRATGGAGTVDLDFGDVTGLENLTFRRLADNIQVDNVTDVDTNLKIENTASAASVVTVNFDAAQVSGTADKSNLTVENTTAGADFTINGVETIAVTAVGSDNDIDIDGDALETVTVAGAGDISIDVDASVTTFDASANTGGATMVATAAADVTATGGDGDDTFTMGATLTADDTIDGGDGTDTLTVNNDGAALTVIPASSAVSNVETLRIEATDDSAIDAFTLDANTVSFDTITIDVSDERDTYAITDYTDETINLVESANNALDLIDVSFADATGTADALTLNITNNDAATAFTVDDINSTGGGIETLNLVLNQGADIADASDITVDDISSAHDTVNISGDADATFGADAGLTAETINASTATGDLTLNLGAADQTVTAGSGADTIAFAGTLTSDDTADGGDGDDTLTATLTAARIAATVSNIETGSFDFDAAGTLDMRSITDMSTLTLQGQNTHSVVNADSSVSTINLIEEDEDEVVNITFDTGTASALTLNFDEVTDGGTETYEAITVSGNTGDFTVNSADGDYQVTSITNATTTGAAVINTTDLLQVDGADGIDMVNATSLAVTTGGGDLDISGASTNDFNDATSISLNALDGDILIDDNAGVLESEADVTVDMTARGAGNLIDITTLNVDHVTTMSLSATNGGDIDLTDVNFLGVDADGDDVSTSFTMNASGTGSSVIIQDVTPAAASTLDSLVMTSSDSGVVSFTAGDNLLTITEIDASGANADDVVIDVSDLAAATEITLGAGDATVTASDNGDTIIGGSGDVQYFLTAGGTHSVTAGSGVDTFEAVGMNASEISSFTVGTDKVELDESVIEAASSGTDLVNGNGDAVSALTAVVIDDVDTTGDYTMDVASSVLRLDGVYADADAVDAELIGATGLQDSNFADDDILTVIWSDGTDAHISFVDINTADGGIAEVSDVTVEDSIVLVGVDASTLTADDFNSIFTA